MADSVVRSGSRADRRRRDEGLPTGRERRGLDVARVEVKWHIEPEGILITLAHPLVISNCFTVRDRLVRYVERFTARRFTVDLAGVPYVDTAGFGVLMELKVRCMRERKEFVVRNPTPRVREMLELLHLDGKLLTEQ